MLISFLLKGTLLFVSLVLFSQWLLMVTKVERSMNLLSIRFDGAEGHNMFLGDFGGLILGIAVMTVFFVFHSPLWMYPLMLLSTTVLVGRLISFAQKGKSSVGVIGMIMEILGLVVLMLFANNFVTY